jgi:5'-nucleotidase
MSLFPLSTMIDSTFDQNRPLIMLTNDDGISAPGLHALATHITNLGELAVFAPLFPRSGASHAVTIFDPIRVVQQDFPHARFAMATSGTPADSVKMGMTMLAKTPPKLVLSGINLGPNTGSLILYSGTVSAAREACFKGVTALAVSICAYRDAHFDTAAHFALQVSSYLLDHPGEQPRLWNLNVPNLPHEQVKGIRLTNQGASLLKDHFKEHIDPRDGKYYWLVDDGTISDKSAGCDEQVVEEGYCSLTPLTWDQTDYRQLKRIEKEFRL